MHTHLHDHDWMGLLFHYSPKVVTSILIFLVFYIISLTVKRIRIYFVKEDNEKRQVIQLITKILRAAIVILGLTTAFGTIGMDITALVAGLGLTGFAVGFATKDYLSNIMAGILIILQKPFKFKSRIKVAGQEGVVEEINLRYTQLNDDGRRILIPNAKVITDVVIIYDEAKKA